MDAAVKAAGYPPKADPAKVDKLMLVVLLTIMVIYVTMVYGPIAAMLVELFPTKIRYTSMSLPYHIGNGWFGGFPFGDPVHHRGLARRHLLRSVVSDHLRRR